jgi:ADP-ribose pyrophosphatase YjhB (NUDIX family)
LVAICGIGTSLAPHHTLPTGRCQARLPTSPRVGSEPLAWPYDTRVDPELAAYLARHPAGAEESAVWGAGRPIFLRISGHLAVEPPPTPFVQSVRALLFRGDELMVLSNRDSPAYVVPGGRREGDEPPDAALRREVGEETGWTLRDPRLVGFYWMHHTTPRPADYPYLYPDFLQPVYMAEAAQHRPELLVDDGTTSGPGSGRWPRSSGCRSGAASGSSSTRRCGADGASRPAGRWPGMTRPRRA